MGLLIRFVINCVALWLTSVVVSGITVDGTGTLLIAALVLGILNTFLRPLLLILTLPINLLTLGLFTLLINGFVLNLVGAVVDGFHVVGFFSAVIGALLLSVFSFVLSVFVADTGRIEVIYVRR